jgi:PAS domain S-box-containing protein
MPDAAGSATTANNQTTPPEPFETARADVLERMGEGFYTIDREWRFTYVNRIAELFWRRMRGELLGKDMRTVFPNFVGSQSYRAHEAALRDREELRVETQSAVTGAPIELRLFPDLFGLTVFFRDLTGQRKLEEDLRARDAMLTLAERSAGIGVWTADLEAQTVRGTAQFFELLGLEPTDAEISMEIPRSVRHPEDRERVLAGFRQAIADGSDSYEAEYRIIRGGEVRWIFGRGLVMRDATGVPIRYSGVDIDITERKRQAEQVQIVLRELQHRTNNMLAVIQAMAGQTSRKTATVSEFVETFCDRLRSLSDSNRLLVEENWHGCRLDELIRRQLMPFVDEQPERLEMRGPPLMLKPEAVHTIGLAFHELATNATKYGALSVYSGRISLSWEIESDGDGQKCVLEWREAGGPRVNPPDRDGFGRYVIERMVGQSLGGRVSIEFPPEGIRWRLETPLSHLVTAGHVSSS